MNPETFTPAARRASASSDAISAAGQQGEFGGTDMTANAQHTSGPWTAARWSCNADTAVIAANGTVVCETAGLGRRSESCEIDATLIAAAPELLEACKAMLRALRREGCDDPQAAAAIAKAEGRAS